MRVGAGVDVPLECPIDDCAHGHLVGLLLVWAAFPVWVAAGRLPAGLDLVPAHYLGDGRAVICELDDAVRMGDGRLLVGVHAGLVVLDYEPAALDRQFELVAFVYDHRQDFGHASHALSHGDVPEVGLLERKLVAVCDEVGLLLRWVQATDHHAEEAVGDAGSRACLKDAAVVLVLGVLQNEPGRMHGVRGAVPGRQVQLSGFDEVLNAIGDLVDNLLLDLHQGGLHGFGWCGCGLAHAVTSLVCSSTRRVRSAGLTIRLMTCASISGSFVTLSRPSTQTGVLTPW